MYNKKNKKQKGFTLVEMLVSVAIFSIVLVVIMGTIVTIVDVSRKARTMTEVMNNLNFTFESMTRTLKTATNAEVIVEGGKPVIVANNQDGKVIKYRIEEVDNKNKLQKSYDNGEYIDLTSEEVDITEYILEELKTYNQPRVFFSMKGRVETAKGIVSEFSMQTTVSQRPLEINP